MPLIMGKSPKSFGKNVKTEMHEGKSMPQSLAIAYAMKRKAKKEDEKDMACGGKMAEGGFVREEEESGYESMPHVRESHMYEHPVENQDDHEDMVGHIMRMRGYSEGGKVANDTPDEADFEDNDFDDMEKDDDMHFNYTGANSGDEMGDAQEDDDRDDMISMIMKSRRKKDKMPHPA